MNAADDLELYCPQCSATELCSVSSMIARLRSAGLLKREAKPDLEIVRELFRSSVHRFSCHDCGRVGLATRISNSESWPEVRTCQECGVRIPAERLELFPKATRCAACESRAAAQSDEPEYCPRCGGIMKVTTSRPPGISRYVLSCPTCRR